MAPFCFSCYPSMQATNNLGWQAGCTRTDACLPASPVQDPDGKGYHNWANVSAVFAKHWKDIGIPVFEEIWNEPDLVGQTRLPSVSHLCCFSNAQCMISVPIPHLRCPGVCACRLAPHGLLSGGCSAPCGCTPCGCGLSPSLLELPAAPDLPTAQQNPCIVMTPPVVCQQWV